MDIKLEELLNEVKFWLEKAERAMNVEVENLNLENLPKIKSIDEK
jgi:hypothetical protein